MVVANEHINYGSYNNKCKPVFELVSITYHENVQNGKGNACIKFENLNLETCSLLRGTK